MRLASLGAMALTASTVASCYALRSTSSCDVDRDCERGTFCAADGYCRTGGPISVGVLVPQTGNQASLAPERLDGLRFGQWVVERDPGRRVLGRGLRLVFDDTLSSVEETPRATSRLIARNIVALIGPAASAEVLEAQKVTLSERILTLAPSAGASAVGDAQGPAPQRYLFQLSTEIPNGSIRALPLFLAAPNRPASFDACYDGAAIVVADDATGASYERALSNMLPPNCVPVTRVVRTGASKKSDYSAEVDALVSARNGGTKTQCLILSARPDVAGELLRTLKDREAGSTDLPYSAFLASSLLHSPSFFDETKSAVAGRPSLAEGFYGVDSDSSPQRAAARDLAHLYDEYKAGHPDVDSSAELTGDRARWAEAVIMLAIAIEQAGSVADPAALRDAFLDIAQPNGGDLAVGPKELDLAFARIRAARVAGRHQGIDYRGSQSNYDFDDRGFVQLPAQVWLAKGGQIQERWAGFEEDQLAAVVQQPGPACTRKPR